jgi:hypothetical protein
VVGADKSDPRWHAVDEAVEFWNQQLNGAGVDVRLGPITRLMQPVPDDALRQLSAEGGIWSRQRGGSQGPPFVLHEAYGQKRTTLAAIAPM